MDDESGAPFDGAPGPLNNFSSFTVRGIQASKKNPYPPRALRSSDRRRQDLIQTPKHRTLSTTAAPCPPFSFRRVATLRPMSPGVTSSQSQPLASGSFPTRGPHEFIRSARVHHVTSISAEYRQICPRQFQRVKWPSCPLVWFESTHQLSGNRAHRQTQVLGISVRSDSLRVDSVRVNRLISVL